jgi:GGDEF domain-containing protein
MISIKRYLAENSIQPVEKGYRRILSMVLKELAISAIEGDPAEFEQFNRSISRFNDTLDEDGGLAEALVTAEAALQVLAEHNQRTKAFLRQPVVELQSIISMLTETIAEMASGCDTSVRRLQSVERHIEKARHINDVQELKGRLLECLEQQTARATAGKIHAELECSKQLLGQTPTELDPVTALPAEGAVAEALRVRLKRDAQSYVAAFVVQNVRAINIRFGDTIGDQVLRAFRDHLRASLPPADGLYRWSGPTVVALIERAQPEERVRAEMKKIAESREGRMFEIRNREVMIAIAANWSLVPVVDSVASIKMHIDKFVASQLPAMANAT